MKNYFLMTLAALSFVACSQQKKAEEAPAPKVLVLYYSQTGTTKTVAEEIQKQLNADIEAIEAEVPYDGDYMQTVERCGKEMQSSEAPAIKPIKANIADYDVVFLGYPVWYGTYARPIAGLLSTQKFENKKVVSFCTFGSGGLQATTRDLKAALPQANVVEGYGVRTARVAKAAEELNRFLIEGGYKEGQIEAVAPFGEHKAVTEADVEVFNQACGDYQFPLGTPVDVSSRETATSTDYEFTASSRGMNGEESTVTIYVTVSKEDGSKPEFTQVAR